MKSFLFTTMIMSGAISLSLILAPTVAAQPLRPPDQKSKFRQVEEPIKGRYIVVLKDNVPAASISLMGDEMVSAYRGKVRHKFTHAIKGFAAEMSETEAIRLTQDPRVDFVEEDGVMYPDAATTQNTTAATWGLDRSDQRNLPLNNLYSYRGSGFGVNAYVIDTGIRATHQDFAGRVATVRDYVGDGQNGNDCNGHGTHVAGTLGGRTFGVAKDVRIHSLRVFGCSGGSPTSTITRAVDWVRANYVKPAVTNMSLGGGASDSLDKAVRNLTAAGVPVVVAAGNANTDASGTSPARVTEAITVGSTTNTDARRSDSNFGPVVDVFAPGDNVTSAWIGSDTATNAIGGTSMAAPHVAGMVARYLETDPYAFPSAVSSLIVRNATNGVVGTPGAGSPNRLLYTVLPKPMDQPKYGNFDFDDGGKEDILVQSAWGIGILTYDGSSLTTLMLAPNGTRFGGWLYNSAGDHIVAVADFDGDSQDEILITSAWGIGILEYDGSSLTSLMLAPNETSFGGWRFQSGVNRIAGTADFNGDGRQDIVVTSGWGIGILTYDGSSLTSLMLAPNGTLFGGWRFASSDNSLEGFGDFDGNGKDDVLIRSAWGMGLLKFDGTTLVPLMVVPNGTKFGSWTFNSKNDRIAGIGSFDDDLREKDEILITSNSGLAVLRWNGSKLTSLTKASNGTRLGSWLLNTKNDYIGRIGDVNDNFKDDIIFRSGWGIGILTYDGSSLTTLMLAPNGTRFGGWLYNSANDQILGIGSFGSSLVNDILITSPWGIGILRFAGTSLGSRMLAPNGSRFGGWLFGSTVNQVGIYSDIY